MSEDKSMELFKNNPENAHLFNKGTSNISVNGNNNTINQTVNHFSDTKIKRIIEDHQHDETKHLSAQQQKEIQEQVVKIGDMLKDISSTNYYQAMYGKLKKRYKVPKYSLILKDDFDDARKYLQKEFHILRRSILKSKSSIKFKEITIPLIKIHWSYVRPNDDLLEFAATKLNKHIVSLSKLSANDIDTLYSRVHSLRKQNVH